MSHTYHSILFLLAILLFNILIISILLGCSGLGRYFEIPLMCFGVLCRVSSLSIYFCLSPHTSLSLSDPNHALIPIDTTRLPSRAGTREWVGLMPPKPVVSLTLLDSAEN